MLQHGCPVAWRSGIPFGIVLQCTMEGFVAMCDAFGQGHLSVGENLEIRKIISKFFSLIRRKYRLCL